MIRTLLLAAVTIAVASAAPAADLVTAVPGFAKAPFKVYSGYLTVPGPIPGSGEAASYSSLAIHYEFHEAQTASASAPLVTWHQGGPGGSSMYGAVTEMGYFQESSNGSFVNPYAWNKVANMLYLESPAGSNDPLGFSTCSVDDKVSDQCSWDDKTQAVAYGHTLEAFFKAFPEYKKNALFLTGESYAGQYVPNIATFILSAAGATASPTANANLKGIAVGNGCWGGTATEVDCNGPNSDQNDVDMYYGKGLVAKKTYIATNAACKWPATRTLKCQKMLDQVDKEVGPHNVYDIYDNCPSTAEWVKRSGKTMRFLKGHLRKALSQHEPKSKTDAYLKGLAGGYDWACGGMSAMANFYGDAKTRTAMHLGKPGVSQFGYRSSGPASVTLYPTLVKKIRVMIYNGDSDSCVPYKGNEEWTTAVTGTAENKGWHPWFTPQVPNMPAGYSTTYNVTGSPHDFSFVTIRLAGHMVPTFQPAPAYHFFSEFIAGRTL